MSNLIDKDDTISRADAIRWVKTECNPYGKPTLDYDSGLRVIKHLKKMPSAKPITSGYIADDKEVPTYTTTSAISEPPACRSCSNHPKNGGSGICHCILGGVKING